METALLAIPATEAAAAIRGAIAIWNGATAAADKFGDITDAIEDYFGGPPDEVFPNKNGDIIMMGDGKKIRFDIENSHGYEPHFHIEQESSNGDWEDAGSQHMYFFNNE